MSVETILAHIQLAVLKPADITIHKIEGPDIAPFFAPVQSLGFVRPKIIGIIDGLFIQFTILVHGTDMRI